jgi:hypothetical protein
MIRLFRVSFPPSIVALFIIEAFLAVGAYVFTFQIRSSEDWVIWLLYEGGFDRVGLVVASILLGVYFNDLYSEIRVTSRVWLVQKFCLVFGIAFMSQELLESESDPGALAHDHRQRYCAGGHAVLANRV